MSRASYVLPTCSSVRDTDPNRPVVGPFWGRAPVRCTMAVARVKAEPPADTPLKQLAVDILRTRGELKPSVDVVLNSALDEDGKIAAMELFQAALDDPWDPMRNPNAAVAAITAQRG